MSFPMKRHIAVVLFALALLAAAPYMQTLRHDFVEYDDAQFVTENAVVQRGLTVDGFLWAFTSTTASNWHPLTMLSHMLDVEIWGLWPGGHHLTNVIFHIANSLLVFLAMWRMSGALWRSAFVAAVFAVHPLHVESVAWVAERKDVLSTFFGLLAIWAYAAYVARPSAMRYGLVLLLFLFSLLSKAMLVTLPLVLLLLDYWPLNRFAAAGHRDAQPASMARILLEKVPMLVMSIALCVVTVIAQKTGGSIHPIDSLPIDFRLANAVVAYVSYLFKTLWPVELAVLYPYPSKWPAGQVAGSFVLLCAITGVAFWMRKKRPALLVGWLWFLGTLVPVIGLVQVGMQAMADRYMYVPMIGLTIMAAWAVPSQDTQRASPHVKIVSAVAALMIVTLSARAYMQVLYWRDGITLLTRTLAITTNNFISHNNLGHAFARRQNHERAVEQFREAIRIYEGYAMARANLGSVLTNLGQHQEAERQLRAAIAQKPELAEAHSRLGIALHKQNKLDDAIAKYREAIGLNPRDAKTYANLGLALAQQFNFPEAERAYREALKLDPNLAEVHAYLGVALAAQDRLEEAIRHFREALRLNPGDANAKEYLEMALKQQAERAPQ